MQSANVLQRQLYYIIILCDVGRRSRQIFCVVEQIGKIVVTALMEGVRRFEGFMFPVAVFCVAVDDRRGPWKERLDFVDWELEDEPEDREDDFAFVLVERADILLQFSVDVELRASNYDGVINFHPPPHGLHNQ